MNLSDDQITEIFFELDDFYKEFNPTWLLRGKSSHRLGLYIHQWYTTYFSLVVIVLVMLVAW